ncbi:Proprotein convertase subtilisin/kexin type 9 [Nibea albiflora]|uniref:Proprotein convertase subtilisin/kexin type 9 n=1 Tax=Nibea albiflora TaxID=240163 RepID=A0ACB7EMI1_NIBAL|nr:Proprotein convertase subtilisin/kexin type 9 [Nibea albiflora]
MRRTCGWIGWALCLCASLTVSAQDYPEDDDMILDLIREDGTQPETGAVPAADFLRCNKVCAVTGGLFEQPGFIQVMIHVYEHGCSLTPGRTVGDVMNTLSLDRVFYIFQSFSFMLEMGRQRGGCPVSTSVILRPGTHESHVQRTIRRLRAKAAQRGYLLEILKTYSGALHGFLVKMSSDVLHLVTASVELVVVAKGGGELIVSVNDGGKVAVYLMDGSVQSSHREVEGRVLITDFNSVPEEDGVRVHRQASQCDSHGTHMAGVVSGSDSGVARGAGVNLVRVLNCQGKGTVSGALAGMEYIRAALLTRPVDAVVVLLPFIGGFSRSLNTACQDMVANGAVVIAAAGNYRDDACLYSPASEPEVITVGAVNSADQLMSQGAGGTNFGSCVDLFAPGDDIVSASSDCSTCFTSRSGTSQAAAHAAGVAAVILSSNQNMSPVQVLQTMLRYSISNTINFLSLTDTHRLVTPNLVAAMPPDNSTDVELLCRSVWSERSGVTSTDKAISRCQSGGADDELQQLRS